MTREESSGETDEAGQHVTKRDATKDHRWRLRAPGRPSLLATTVTAALLVPVGVSWASPTAQRNAPGEDSSDGIVDAHDDLYVEHADDEFEQVGDLILVSDPAPLGPFPADEADDGVSAAVQAAPTFDEAFTLHSRPQAARKILLDFDGELVESEHWNGGDPIDAAAYSRGTDQADESFSPTDLIEIERIWARVAEDFAAWDVDVTTEDPGAAGLSRNGAGDDEYGVRVVITPSYQWYSSTRYGGVAYLHTFDRSDDLPAWVFASNLGNGNAKSVAEAVSHEVGHTLGLSHDGATTTDSGGNTSTVGYYGGHGDWAPIMGVGYYRPITQWSKGEYPGATNTQDDLAIIDTYITRIGPDEAPAVGTGVIGPGDSNSTHSLTDGGRVDTHTLQIQDAPVEVSVRKADPEGNLLAELRIRNSAGVVVASATPSGSASWSLDVTLPTETQAGLYTVEVESVGWAPSADPGFSSYASMGDYVLDIDAPGAFDDPTSPDTPTTPPPSDTPTPPGTQPPPSDSGGDRLTATTPRRVLDTRNEDSAVIGPIPAGRDIAIDLEGVPAGATAVVLNVTAVAPQADGFLTVTPCEAPEAGRTSSLNFEAGRNIANSLIVPISTSGKVCLFSSVPAHALLDLTGWISAEGDLSLAALDSTRVVDTRTGTGINTRLRAGEPAVVSLASVLDNDDVSAVALNVTAIRPAGAGFLTIEDCTTGQTPTSSLNFVTNETRGNNGVFALGTGQQLCVTSSVATHVTIDVTGVFGTDPGLTFVPSSAPERILDTRRTSRVAAGGTATFDVETNAATNTLQRSPVAASVNLTATRHDDNGFVTAWACGDRPDTSALNPSAGAATANGALVELSPSGTTCLFHASGGHLIVDLAGWWI